MAEIDLAILTLILPCAHYAESYRRYIAELGDEERYPFPLDFAYHDFPVLLDRLAKMQRGLMLPAGSVANTTFWLVDGERLLGVSSLRHYLSPELKHVGGHIGIGIRPSARKLGVGRVLMEKTIEQAKAKGIKPVHIHCYADNTASAQLIQRCGGQLHSVVTLNGQTVNRYLVD